MLLSLLAAALVCQDPEPPPRVLPEGTAAGGPADAVAGPPKPAVEGGLELGRVGSAMGRASLRWGIHYGITTGKSRPSEASHGAKEMAFSSYGGLRFLASRRIISTRLR